MALSIKCKGMNWCQTDAQFWHERHAQLKFHKNRIVISVPFCRACAFVFCFLFFVFFSLLSSSFNEGRKIKSCKTVVELTHTISALIINFIVECWLSDYFANIWHANCFVVGVVNISLFIHLFLFVKFANDA